VDRVIVSMSKVNDETPIRSTVSSVAADAVFAGVTFSVATGVAACTSAQLVISLPISLTRRVTYSLLAAPPRLINSLMSSLLFFSIMLDKAMHECLQTKKELTCSLIAVPKTSISPFSTTLFRHHTRSPLTFGIEKRTHCLDNCSTLRIAVMPDLFSSWCSVSLVMMESARQDHSTW
jgi:hypothetical protein